MGGLMSAGRLAQLARGRDTIVGGIDSERSTPATYEDDLASAPVKAAYAEDTAPARPAFNESQALLPDDPSGAARGEQRNAPPQEEYREDTVGEQRPESVRVAQSAQSRQSSQGGATNVSNSTAPRTKSDAEKELDKNPALKAILERATKSRNVNPLWPIVYGYQESGWNPNNKTGSYKGVFQLSKDEFQELMKKGKVKQGADIFDPEPNIIGGIEKFLELHSNFVNKYQREPSLTELYLNHNQGPAGFEAHYRNPNQLAWESMRNTGESKKIANYLKPYKKNGIEKWGPAAADEWAKDTVWGNVPGDLKKKYTGLSVDNLKSGSLLDLWKEKFNDDGRYGKFFIPKP